MSNETKEAPIASSKTEEAPVEEVVVDTKPTKEASVEVQETPSHELELDSLDPLVVGLTWALTLIASKVFIKAGYEKAKASLPAIALLSALACRVVFDGLYGVDITGDTVIHALGAAGVAVMGHSQFRSITKAMSKKEEE